MNPDLHCHSTESDGVLSPTDIAKRAAANGVSLWTLTDHDCIDGLAPAREAAREAGMRFLDGVEISVTWNFQTLHIVGLNIDPSDPVLNAGLSRIRSSRHARAEKIAGQLTDAGIAGSLEGAYAYARNPNLISRTHFARFLVARGYARNLSDVFQRYLSPGRIGGVPHQWAQLREAINWIRSSGGVAILAHPGRHKLSRVQLVRLVEEFKSAGGVGIEVITANHDKSQAAEFGMLCRAHGLLGSRGSDFHSPDDAQYDLGKLPDLPSSVEPVWSLFG